MVGALQHRCRRCASFVQAFDVLLTGADGVDVGAELDGAGALLVEDVGFGALLLGLGDEDEPPDGAPDFPVDPDLSTAVGSPGFAGGT